MAGGLCWTVIYSQLCGGGTTNRILTELPISVPLFRRTFTSHSDKNSRSTRTSESTRKWELLVFEIQSVGLTGLSRRDCLHGGFVPSIVGSAIVFFFSILVASTGHYDGLCGRRYDLCSGRELIPDSQTNGNTAPRSWLALSL